MGRIISFFNQKGGVGKTTIVENLGFSLCADGKRVLLVDIDPQCNLTTTYGLDPYDEDADNIHDVLMGEMSAVEAIRKDVRPGIDMLPAGADLFICERELMVGKTLWFKVLEKALKPVAKNYDFILIDCSPSLGSLTVNALVAADEIYAPLLPESHAIKGLRMMRQAFKYNAEDIERNLAITGIIITQFDQRLSTVHEPNVEIVRSSGIPVLESRIQISSGLKKAQQARELIYEFDPTDRACQEFDALRTEILKGVQK